MSAIRLTSWEILLVVLLVVVVIINSFLSPYYLDIVNLFDSTSNFTEKAIIALPMALVIISRDIDLSVASNIALTSTIMGFIHALGFDTEIIILAGLIVGASAGALNGYLIAVMNLPSIVVTIGTMSFFRGISYVILEDKAYTQYPESFTVFGQGYLFDLIPYSFIIFMFLALLFIIVMRFSALGRKIYAMGRNPRTALYSGIQVNKYRFFIFVIMGISCAISAVLLTGRIDSTKPLIALGWELEIITIVILGGISIAGGHGTILGVILASFIFGSIIFGLSLINIPGIIISIIIGTLLIVSILLSKFKKCLNG